MTTALSNFDIVSDGELARAAATGDRRAFAMIYDRYADRLHDFCIGMVRDRDTAADCVQDVFCSAATQLPKLRDPERLRPWLYAIARNEALRCIRDRRREQVSDELPEAASHDAGPDTLAARNELAALVAEAAGGLVDRDRAVLELAYRHGLDGPELANALEVSPGTANKMVSRLRNTIESSLGALLVARRAQHTADKCAELGTILAGWDGRFSVLMRKRITRHIESCAVCEEERRRLVNPVALLGAAPVFIPAPGWLRDQTLGQIRLTSADSDLGGDSSGDGHGSSDDAFAPTAASWAAAADQHDGSYLETAQAHRARRLIPWIALFAGTFFLALGLMYSLLYHHKTAITPTELSRFAPAPMMKAPAPPAANQIPPAPPANPPAPIYSPPAVQAPVAPAPPVVAPPVAPPPVAPP
ncbi:RNA polymerase sigma factor, partial [Mycobacterium sp. 1245805.9]|uniref:RNA polymerase sigma factor n=1 Tax=Mycobacterium sp. 1245805.9 TaxID=1856862 RepID=UPI0007FF239B